MGALAAVPPVRARVGPIARVGAYWSMVKSLQSALLLMTAVAGYVSGCCLNLTAASLGALLGSMGLAVAGSTVFNMVLDRDIDARMDRTATRPLPAGIIGVGEALGFGIVLSTGGVAWAFSLFPLYGWLVLAGWVLDVVVYSWLLKRRTPWSILIGGVSGGMPVLAGRALATGTVDLVGVLLALGVLLWIPLHILTFAISKAADYARAGIPTIPARYGHTATRWLISGSILGATAALLGAIWQLTLPLIVLGGLAGTAVVLALLTLAGIVRPRPVLEFVLYKGASLYMLAVMGAIVVFGF